MKKIIFILLLFPALLQAQVKVKDLPNKTSNFKQGDNIIIDDSAGAAGATKKISIRNLKTNYDFSSASSAIKGTGTPYKLPLWVTSDSLGDSRLTQTNSISSDITLTSGTFCGATSTEIGLLNGLTSNAQTQLNDKINGYIYGKGDIPYMINGNTTGKSPLGVAPSGSTYFSKDIVIQDGTTFINSDTGTTGYNSLIQFGGSSKHLYLSQAPYSGNYGSTFELDTTSGEWLAIDYIKGKKSNILLQKNRIRFACFDLNSGVVDSVVWDSTGIHNYVPSASYSYATPSTVASFDASKNLVSIPNGTGVLTNNGSGVLTWGAAGSSDTTSLSNRINLKSDYTDTLKFMHKLYSLTETITGNKTFSGSNAYGTPASIVLTNGTGLTEAGQTLANNTTNDVSITKHGYAPIAPNDASKYLDGTGAYSAPSAASINGVALGNIITEPFNNLTNFTQTGSAFTQSGSACNVSSAPGAVSFASYIRQTQYGNSDLEESTITMDLTIGTINATSWGVGVGYKSNGTYSSTAGLCVGFLMDNTNKGKIAFYFNNSVTGAVVSSSAITIASGNVTSIKIRQLKNTFIATWTNGTQVLTAQYVYTLNTTTLNPTIATLMPNAYNYTIYALGGSTHVIDNFIVNCDQKKSPDILFCGDSELKGYDVGTVNNRASDLISLSTQSKVSVVAGQGDAIQDLSSTEILSLTPGKIVLSIGTNNLALGSQTAAQAMTALNTLTASLVSGGYVLGTTLFVTTQRPRNGTTMTVFNDSIRQHYPTSFIELYYPFWSGTGFTINPAYASLDNVHLNAIGAKLEASVYVNYFNLKTIAGFDYNNTCINSNQMGQTPIGLSNTDAKYALDVYSTAAQIRFGNSLSNTSDGGGFLTALSTNNATFFGGLAHNGSNWTYKATSYSGLATFAGDLYFYGATGVSIGSTTSSPAVGMRMLAGGYLYIGGSTSPTAVLHLKAGTSSASTAPLKFTSGTNLTSAEAGAMEYDGTSLFFTNGGAQRQQIAQVQNSRVTSKINYTTTTTLANITGLTATLVAGKTYEFEAVLHDSCDATGGNKFAIAGTATATNIIYEIIQTDNSTLANTITSRQTALAGSAGQAGTTSGYCKIRGVITVNGAGTLTVQFAQNASSGTSSILQGSIFKVTQIP